MNVYNPEKPSWVSQLTEGVEATLGKVVTDTETQEGTFQVSGTAESALVVSLALFHDTQSKSTTATVEVPYESSGNKRKLRINALPELSQGLGYTALDIGEDGSVKVLDESEAAIEAQNIIEFLENYRAYN